MNITLPLEIKNGALVREEKMKGSLNRHIDTLLRTAKGDVICDPEYGFILTTLKFENFNENEGTVLDYLNTGYDVYEKKISGTSNNLQTFAAEFNKVLQKYEPRLKDTSVVMTYIRENREIRINIHGTVATLNIPYLYQTVIKVWQ